MRLSAPAAHSVSVNYAYEASSGTVANGTLTFAPGETLAWATGVNAQTYDALRFRLSNPSGAPLVNPTNVYFFRSDASLSPAPPPITALASNSSGWKYSDEGIDLGTAWRSPGYNDTGWSNGIAELGFGDGDENLSGRMRRTVNSVFTPTFYFRKTIVLSNVTSIANLSMFLLWDDGGVVYINGNEVFRTQTMPQPPTVITYATLATNLSIPNAPNDDQVDRAVLPATGLVNGTNTIAVEIHQHDTGSSDVSFDLELIANMLPPAVPQTLRFGKWDGQFTFGWTDGSYVLDQAPTVTGTWQQVTAPSPVFITPTNQQQYFRLRR